MAINIKQINVKNSQNLIEIPFVGKFKFVEWASNRQLGCWDCDLRSLGVCSVIPCSMSFRSDQKDGVFKSINK